eukprot:TRINITY_DN2576_c0_g1_i1.p1 TRINITY_DN2576_c0_g1~~TRINITY_DN2576_c0_g1_i1.p1  ORF type:complete len:292 (-),score=28.72 TRINITY_DN2576_c0_g1_i1:277-1152(-)
MVDVAKDRHSHSYMHIEIIFEYDGVGLETLKPTSIDLTYNLMRQSANALFLLHNLGIAHFDIKPENMVYDTENDLLKLIDMGSAFGSTTRSKIGATTMKLEGKMRSGTLEYAPPEVVKTINRSIVAPKEKLILDAIDIYCWGMSFYTLLSNKNYADLKNDYRRYKMGTDKAYSSFMESIENFLNSIEVKSATEQKMKSTMKEILTSTLEYVPKKRPKMKEIISKMRELEKANNISINYSQTELSNNKKISDLLMIDKIGDASSWEGFEGKKLSDLAIKQSLLKRFEIEDFM